MPQFFDFSLTPSLFGDNEFVELPIEVAGLELGSLSLIAIGPVPDIGDSNRERSDLCDGLQAEDFVVLVVAELVFDRIVDESRANLIRKMSP